MEEYKPNSHMSKEKEHASNEKKLEKVISGTATTEKKSKIQKFADTFISEDSDNVKNYIFTEAVVPTTKKLVLDIVTNVANSLIDSANMILYGKSGQPRRNYSGSKVSYREEPKRYDDTMTRGFNYDNIIFDTYADAEIILDTMNEIIDQYGVVSIADLYDLADVATDNYSTAKYGWTDLRGCKIARAHNGGYILRFPKPMPLD